MMVLRDSKWQRILESRTCLTFDNSHKPGLNSSSWCDSFAIIYDKHKVLSQFNYENNWVDSYKKSLKHVAGAWSHKHMMVFNSCSRGVNNFYCKLHFWFQSCFTFLSFKSHSFTKIKIELCSNKCQTSIYMEKYLPISNFISGNMNIISIKTYTTLSYSRCLCLLKMQKVYVLKRSLWLNGV